MKEYNETTLQVIRKEKPNSFEWGKPGNRVKIYWDDMEELKKKLMEVNKLMLELDVEK